ncbi:unnamed protein product [Lasius platythorax]|uniref:Uncharacterized protein n=1 Tax=Lasius platythorax TaxID=488582 RepID=A0AAV2N619_9HYME
MSFRGRGGGFRGAGSFRGGRGGEGFNRGRGDGFDRNRGYDQGPPETVTPLEHYQWAVEDMIVVKGEIEQLENAKPSSFEKDTQLYIDPANLLPLQRFLPKPPGEQRRGSDYGRVMKRGAGGRRGSFGRGSSGRGGGGFGNRGANGGRFKGHGEGGGGGFNRNSSGGG